MQKSVNLESLLFDWLRAYMSFAFLIISSTIATVKRLLFSTSSDSVVSSSILFWIRSLISESWALISIFG
jgi:hypothetical protein